ncbi:hypothetical protein HanXRQr2_Chr14g0631901 [Helianthus annuus]|uniref:Uncharacterized protein n=1 Tax=Helianthus annuus TaxID=4232 RepID=A0A9K3H5I5_HELAN|nr:hypothetical protein HanXRQr2_Chr14g0631901 [Helianthus annuus]
MSTLVCNTYGHGVGIQYASYQLSGTKGYPWRTRVHMLIRHAINSKVTLAESVALLCSCR